MKQLVIFGAGDIAELAYFYFTRQKKYKVAAFAVDKEFKKSARFCGLPLVEAGEMVRRFPPSRHSAFAAMSYSGMNKAREDKFHRLKSQGYAMASYVSPDATCLTKDIGENCFILEDNTIQPFVKIGDNVTLWSGNHIGHHSKIGDHCFISSHVVVSGGVTVESNCFIGVNATIRDHVTVRRGTLVGAGALIMADTEERGVYKGVPSQASPLKSDRVKGI